MTAKAEIISSDRIRPSYYARDLQYPTNPLRRSFNEFNTRQRLYIFLVLLAVIIGVLLVMSQVFGRGEDKENLNASNSSETSSSSNQQPIKNTTSKPMDSKPTTSGSTSSTATNSNSTSVTVNGQSVNIPQSGSYDKTMNISGSNVHVSGNSSQSTTGGSATNNSSTNVEVNSE